MIIGFTGSRKHPTEAQVNTFIKLIEEFRPTEFHHGDCVGSDAVAHDLVRLYVPDCQIIIHPPVDESLRAFRTGDSIRTPLTYFARNRCIVDGSEWVIGMPAYDILPLSRGTGGTYYTLSYAERRFKNLRVIWPDGAIHGTVDGYLGIRRITSTTS